MPHGSARTSPPLLVLGFGFATTILAAACSDAKAPTAVPIPVPDVRLAAVTDTAPSATVATVVVPAPAVRVTTPGGAPLAGVKVIFRAEGLGSIGDLGVAVTGSDGLAREDTWTLANRAGTNVLRAYLAGDPTRTVTFRATGIPDSVTTLARQSGDAQVGFFGEPLVNPLVVKVTDRHGNPVPGAEVRFSVVSGGGTVTASARTDPSGISYPVAWKLGASGTQQVLAVAGSAKATFTAEGFVHCTASCEGARQVVFARNGNIFAMRGDGSQLVQLTAGAGYDDPAWSADGSRIAYTGTAQGGSAIYVMNADGSGAHRVAPRGNSPTLSPDGRWVAYILPGDAAYGGGAFVSPVDGDGPTRQVGADRGQVSGTAWSPDGGRIAFVSDYSAFDFAMEVYLTNPDGSNLSMLTNGFFGSAQNWPTYMTYYQPAWSPDGRRMAVVTCVEHQYYSCASSSLSVLTFAKPGETPIVTKLIDTNGLTDPAWLSDSSIMFERDGSVYVIGVDGKGERLFIPNATKPSAR